MRLTAGDKRTFVHMAYHPWGAEVCRKLGLLPPSDDVVRCEDLNASERMREFITSSQYDALATLASWYHEAVAVASSLPEQRTDVEHMLSFFAAAHTFITPETTT